MFHLPSDRRFSMVSSCRVCKRDRNKKLGGTFGKTVFLASEEGESPKRLRVLQRNSYKEFSAEMYICGDMYFPLAAGECIVPDKSFREQRMYPEACKKPYGYLLLKKAELMT